MDDILPIALRLALVVALVLLNGLFVAAEFSIVAVRRTRMETLVEEGRPLARLSLRAIDNMNNYLAATQLGITIASIGLGFVGEPVLAALLEPVFEDLFGETVAGISSHAVAVVIAFCSHHCASHRARRTRAEDSRSLSCGARRPTDGPPY